MFVIKFFRSLIIILPLCALLVSCTSNLSFDKTSQSFNDDDIKNIVALYKSRGDLNASELSILNKMAHQFLLPIKTQFSEDKWKAFYSNITENEQTIERALMDTYGKLVYSIGGIMFYNTDMPYEQQTLYNVSQAGFANIMYMNESSFNDKAEIEYLFENSSQSIQDIFLSKKADLDAFQAKLDFINDGYINVLLISNEAQRESYGLNYNTAFFRSGYGFTSQHVKYYNWISGKYVNILYSVSFLHELVHSYLAINRIALQDMQYDRNDYLAIRNELSVQPDRNIMLEEGLAEYITRNHSVWSKLPIFEPVHSQLNFQQKQGFPMLNLSDMERYYYGDEKRSFEYSGYGLLSAHSLVDFLVERYNIETVVKLIDLPDIENNAENLLGVPWITLIKQWHKVVLAKS
jgi:hypothetical protein